MAPTLEVAGNNYRTALKAKTSVRPRKKAGAFLLSAPREQSGQTRASANVEGSGVFAASATASNEPLIEIIAFCVAVLI
ncbi:MAG TPA: hypothetical protein VJR71_11285 [Pseudolabrys sp.]|nr:hypothetical protein [Pseudolabrys sp.]